MIELVKAPGFVTVQDLGWETGAAWGLPTSGALDRVSLTVANLLVGNRPGAAALEWALGSGRLRFEQDGMIALAGGDADAELDGVPVPSRTTIRVRRDGVLWIRRAVVGRIIYLAVRGGLDVPVIFGSRSTYLPALLGGHHGRRLQTGDRLRIAGDEAGRAPEEGTTVATPIAWDDPTPFALLEGPQTEWLTEASRTVLDTAPFAVSAASDRMGTRLEGVRLSMGRGTELPSEAACVGAMQLPAGGAPIVIGVDGPTVGGYPKVAVLASGDLARFAQCPLGAEARFRWVGWPAAAELRANQRDRLRVLATSLQR